MLTESLAANSFQGLSSPPSAPLVLGLPTLSPAPTGGEQRHTGSTHLEMPWMGSLSLQDMLSCWLDVIPSLSAVCLSAQGPTAALLASLYPGLTRVRVPLLDAAQKEGTWQESPTSLCRDSTALPTTGIVLSPEFLFLCLSM